MNQEINRKIKANITEWQIALNNYSLEELCFQPSTDSWSLGQVYNHLINSTLYYHSKQIEICLSNTENQKEQKSEVGEKAFTVLNGFPPIKIKVPASPQYTPNQPKDKAELNTGLEKVIERIDEILPLLNEKSEQGKTNHPAFSFLNANEWYSLIEMHFRHHLRQKEELTELLKVR